MTNNSKETFKKIIDNSKDLFCLVSEDGKTLYVNRAVVETLGYTVEEYLELEPSTLTHPDDLEMARTLFSRVISEPHVTKTAELRYRHKDGHYIWQEFHATNSLSDPDINAIVINSRDIMDKKVLELEQTRALTQADEMQRFLETALDAFPANTVVLDSDGVIIKVNAAWKRFADDNDGSDNYYLGQNYLAVCETATGIMSEEALSAKDGILKVINGQLDHYFLEYPCHSAEEERWFGMRVTPFAEETPRRVVVAHINITERIQAEEELQALYRATSQLFVAEDLESLAQEIVRAVVQEFDLVDCGFLLISPENGEIIRLARAGEYDIKPIAPLWLEGAGLVPLAIRTETTIYVPDVTVDDNYIANEDRTQSELVIPLITQKGVIAVLDLQSAERDAFSKRDRRILKTFTERVANFIETMRLYEEINKNSITLQQNVRERTLELQTAKEQVEAIFNSSSEGILTASIEHGIQQVNKTFRDMLGYEEEDYFGKPITFFIDEIFHVDLELLIERVIADNTSQRTEAIAKRLDGSHFDVVIGIAPMIHAEGDETYIVCTIHDISEEKKTRQQIAEERNLLRTLIDTSPDYIYIKDLEHRFLLSNEAHAQARGYDSVDDIIGKSDFDFFPPELAQQFKDEEATIFRTGEALVNHEQPSKGNNDGFEWASSTKAPFRNLDGEIMGLVGFTRDITEKRQQEQELRYHASVQESVSDAVIVTDLDYNIQSWNQAAEQIYGWSASEVLGKHSSSILQTHFESEAVREKHRTNLFVTGAWQKDVVQKRKDGTEVYIQSSVTFFKDNYGVPIGIVAVNRDITEQKIREQELRYFASIVENVNDAVITTDMTLQVISWNRGAEELYGWTEDEAIGKPLLEFLGSKSKIGRSKELAFKTLLVEGHLSGEIIQVHKDGREIDVMVSATLIESEDQASNRIVTVNRDVTEQKKRERELLYLAGILDNVSDAVITTDTHFNIISWNRGAEEMYGWTEEEVIGRPVPDLLKTVQITQKTHEEAANTLFTDGQWRGEVIQKHKDGHDIYVMGSVTFIKSEDESQNSVIAVNRDITEQKKREQELLYLAGILDNVSDAVITTDHNLSIVSWNKGAEEMYGWTEDEAIGQTEPKLLQTTSIYDESYRTVAKKLAKDGQWRGELVQKHKDGHSVYTMGSVNIIKNADTTKNNYVAVNHDITERKKAEIALNRKIKEDSEFQKYLTALHEVTIELTLVDDLDRFYEQVVVLGLDRLGFERLAMFLYDSETGNALGTFGTDETGKLTDETHIRFQPIEDGLMLSALIVKERFAYRENVTLHHNQQPIGIGWNAVATIWNGTEVLGWLSTDNAISQEEAPSHVLEILALYSIAVGTLLARKRQEMALMESEQRYRLLADNASDMIMRSDDRGVYSYVSPASQSIVGYTPEEIVGKTLFDFIHPDERKYSVEYFNQLILHKKTVFEFTGRIQHKDGHYIWLEATGHMIWSPEGDLQSVFTIARDITSRKEAEVALQESAEEIADLYNNAPCGYHSLDINGQIVQINDTQLAWQGYERDEVLGHHISEFLPDSSYDLFKNGFPIFLEQGWLADVEVELKCKDGSTFPVLLSATAVYDDNGDFLQSRATVFDITERKQAQSELRESERRFRNLFEVAPIGILHTDSQGSIILVNEQVEDMFGYDRHELLGKSVEILIDETLHEKHVSHRNKYVNNPIVREMGVGLDLYAKHKNGHKFPVEIQLSYIDTAVGVNVLSFIMDITERKQAELTLRDSEQRYRLIADNSTDIIISVKPNREFNYISPSFKSILGYASDEFLDKTIESILHPDDVSKMAQEIQDAVANGDTAYDVTNRYRHKQGHYIWLETQGRILRSADGTVQGFVSASRDITDRKEAERALQESEEQYRRLVETMRGGLVIYDVDNRLTYVNERFCELMGYNREEILGNKLFDFMDEQNAESVRKELNERQDGSKSSYEIVAFKHDRSPVNLLISGSPLTDENGIYSGGFAVVIDISVQKRAEETLRESLAREKELSELKTRFVSMASHEFRTPLATILATTETISAYRHRLSEEKIEARLERIKSQVDHLTSIMDDVLLLAKIQERHVTFKPSKVDLDSLCRSVLDEFESHPRIDTKINYVGEQSLVAYVDKKLMRQIMNNLVSNAIKYSPDDSEIQVRLTKMDKTIILSVRDQGIGIPEDDLKHLFEPFHRAENVGTISGTGLGLVITKEAVELHDGQIIVDTAVGQGTTMNVIIPHREA